MHKTKSKVSVSDQFINDDQQVIKDQHEIATKFNEYFGNIGPNLAKKIQGTHQTFKSYMDHRCPNSVFLDAILESEVLTEIKLLNANTASGLDEVSPKVVKAIADYIVKPLTHIFNLSFLSGIIPNALKIARVTPVYKANSKENFANYRPISVLPCFSKILEKLMYKRAITFLNKNNILSNNQYGFRAGHSTQQVVIELVDKLSQAIERNEYTVGLFLDLSKAFDTVNHHILLEKLEHYGFRGVALEWFKNYLTNRKQMVNYKSVNSDTLVVSCGVPQGSVLGPLLFLIYVNDISQSSSLLSFLLFADDTNLFFSHKDIKILGKTVNEELCKVANWLACNKLSLNVKKTHFMIFKAKNKKMNLDLNIKIGNEIIERVNTNFLGLIIDDDLSWKHHIIKVTSKISKLCGIMVRARHYLPIRTLRTVYNAMVYPYLSYCNVVWASTYPSRLDALYKVQKKILRIITFSKYQQESRQLFVSLQLLNIYELNSHQIGLFMYSYTKGSLPSAFSNYFSMNNSIHEHYTRSSEKLHMKFTRTNYGRFSIKYKGPMIWNTLPDVLKNIKSLQMFRKELKTFVLNQNIDY